MVQHGLFEGSDAAEAATVITDDADGRAAYDPDFLEPAYADGLLDRLQAEIDWQQEFVNMYGRRLAVPRLTAWYGDPGAVYTYSRIENKPNPWTASLRELRHKLRSSTGIRFNSVLLNHYRNGDDGVSWHADDEPELGPQPVIASVSLGATRTFQLQHNIAKTRRSIPLTHGSLLLMSGPLQHCWKHQVPKERSVRAERINLTFRVVTARK